MSKPFHAEDHQMSFTQHLGELRTRLLIASLAVIFCSIFGFTYAKEIIGFLMGPLKEATAGTNIQPDLHYLSLTEPLFQSFKIALFAGIFFAFPVWVWQAWLFIAPGLHPNERRLIGPVLTSSILLFVAGATFAYKIAVPSAYRFLLIYASPLQAQPAAPVRQGGLTLELLPIPTHHTHRKLKPPPNALSYRSISPLSNSSSLPPRSQAHRPSHLHTKRPHHRRFRHINIAPPPLPPAPPKRPPLRNKRSPSNQSCDCVRKTSIHRLIQNASICSKPSNLSCAKNRSTSNSLGLHNAFNFATNGIIPTLPKMRGGNSNPT